MATPNVPALQTFAFDGSDVRTLVIDGEPWWVAADVCMVLEIRNSRQAVSYLDEDEKQQVHPTVISNDGGGDPWIVNEPGLYSLILKSRKPQAKPFKRWITHEVIPQIRRTGSYGSALALPQDYEEALVALLAEVREKKELQGRVAELEPMAEQARHFRSADGLISVPDFANDLKAWAKQTYGVKVKHIDVWDFLGELHLIIRGDSIRHNRATAFATDKDYVREKPTVFHTNTRGDQTSWSPRLTPAGAGYAWDKAVVRITENQALRRSDAA
jgi:anti-repressor protein